MEYVTGEELFVLLTLVAGLRACAADASATPDRCALLHYIGLVVELEAVRKLMSNKSIS